jgi:hypothetical protein
MHNRLGVAIACVLAGGLSGGVLAAGNGGPDGRAGAAPSVRSSPTLRLDLSQGVQDQVAVEQAASEPPQSPALSEEGSAGPTEKRETRFGRTGSQWLTFGAGYAYDFDKESDYNVHAAWSRFLADELEFAVEVGGWYFDQRGDNTGGVNANMVFRWHALHDENYDWTVYGDVGIGLLAAFDLVPDGGTGFNFTPRAGAGFTRRLGDGQTRLQVGVRYHHVSNGRIEGDERNPGRDAVMLYAGIIVPW